MCGIVGIVSSQPVCGMHDRLRRAGEVIRHRGPDGTGRFADDHCILVHNRLAIIDPEGGRQPLFNEDEQLVLVCNGENYNYRHLRQSLEAAGHHMRTGSDSEIILHLYEEHGTECVDRLRGMFSFALWDRRNQELFAARDRLGIKPLYYAQTADGTLLLASEIKAILATGLVKAELCPQALREYLSLKFVVGRRTFFKDIWTLEPGTWLSWRDGQLAIRRWWGHDYQPRQISFAQARDEFREVFRDAVSSHLVSDVPVGAFLSGGLDSSAIAMVGAELYSGALRTYTCGCSEERNGDLHYAGIVARRCRTQQHEVLDDPEQFGDFMKRCLWYLDEPGGGSTAIHGYRVSRRAVQDVKVLLSGEGADEVLGGYGHYWQAHFRGLPPASRLANCHHWFQWGRRAGLMKGLRETLFPAQHDALTLFLRRHYRFPCQWQEEMLGGDLLAATRGFSPADVIRPLLNGLEHVPVCQQLMSLDLRTYLSRILHIYDRMCMATGLENRVPFLDHKLVEYTFSLPPQVLLHGMRSKALLRSLLAGPIGNTVAMRPKQGFTLPVGRWFAGSLRPRIEETLSSLKRRGLFEARAVTAVWQRFLRGEADREAVWRLLSIEYWMQNFIDTNVAETIPFHQGVPCHL